MKVIKAWKEQVILAKSRGLPDVTCANSANVSLSTLKRELSMDEEFRQRFEEAGNNTPPPPSW
jgi:hypothetical protein